MEPIFRKKNRELMLMEIEQDKRLVEASRSGDIDLVKTLLKTGASPDATEYNKSLFYDSKNYLTPLMTAASQGHADVVRWLIENGGRCPHFQLHLCNADISGATGVTSEFYSTYKHYCLVICQGHN
jgi:ankyrin repeat protein